MAFTSDVTTTTTASTCKASQQQLMELWTHLRTTVNNDAALQVALTSGVLSPHHSIGKYQGDPLHLWVPGQDVGVNQVIGELKRGDYGDFFSTLEQHGEKGLFLDGGSNLRFVTLLAALELAHTTIVAFEASSPTWILQQLNLVCNLSPQRLTTIHSMLAALGSREYECSFVEFEWRPTSTITGRNWDARCGGKSTKCVKTKAPIRTVRSVLQQVLPHHSDAVPPTIQVFNWTAKDVNMKSCLI